MAIDASTFYDHPTSQPAAALQQQAPAKTELRPVEVEARQFFNETYKHDAPQEDLPESVKEHRANDEARQMYPDDSLYFKDELKPADDSPEQAAEVLEWKGIARDVGASPQQVAELKDVLGRELANGLPSAEMREAWAAESVAAMQRKYGAELPELLADANKMIARDPRLAAWLDRSGMGNRVEYVERAIELAKQQRMRGRLK